MIIEESLKKSIYFDFPKRTRILKEKMLDKSEQNQSK